jgi:hypothetical protein
MDAGGVVGVLSISVMLNSFQHLTFSTSIIKTLKQVQGDGRERHDEWGRDDVRALRYAAIFDLAQCRAGPCRPYKRYPV